MCIPKHNKTIPYPTKNTTGTGMTLSTERENIIISFMAALFATPPHCVSYSSIYMMCGTPYSR